MKPREYIHFVTNNWYPCWCILRSISSTTANLPPPPPPPPPPTTHPPPTHPPPPLSLFLSLTLTLSLLWLDISHAYNATHKPHPFHHQHTHHPVLTTVCAHFIYWGPPCMPCRAAALTVYRLSYHYSDIIMSTKASQLTSITIVYSNVYSSTDQRKRGNGTQYNVKVRFSYVAVTQAALSFKISQVPCSRLIDVQGSGWGMISNTCVMSARMNHTRCNAVKSLI